MALTDADMLQMTAIALMRHNVSVVPLDGGALLYGYPIDNGSSGTWPLVLEDGVWAAYPQPSSAIYQVEDFSRLAAYVIGLSVANMDESYSTVVA